MTNKFYTETANLSVYVVNLNEYDKCNLEEDYTPCNPTEAWVSLPISKADWKDFLKTIGNPEKIAIHDCENNSNFDGFEIKESASIEDLNKLARKLEEIKTKGLTNEFNALHEALGDFEEALEYLETNRYLFYSGVTMEEVAKNYVEINCTIPKYLENYIDYKAFANDMHLEIFYTKTAYGVIEIL